MKDQKSAVKRNSMGKRDRTPGSGKKGKFSPKNTPQSNQKGSPGTPFNKQMGTPILNKSSNTPIQCGKKDKSNKKRKSSFGKKSENEESNSGKQSVQMFSGTLNLAASDSNESLEIFSSKIEDKGSEKTPRKVIQNDIQTPDEASAQSGKKNKSNRKRKLSPGSRFENGDSMSNKSPKLDDSTGVLSDSRGGNEKTERTQKESGDRKEVKKQRRKNAAKRRQDLILKIRQGEPSAIAEVEDRIRKLSDSTKLSTAAKKKLRKYRNMLRPGSTPQSFDTHKTDLLKSQNFNNKTGNQKKAQPEKKKAKKQQPQKSTVLDDSDYDVETEVKIKKQDESEDDEVGSESEDGEKSDSDEEAEEDSDEVKDEQEEENDSDDDNDDEIKQKDNKKSNERKNKQANKGKDVKAGNVEKGESRYVMFVGNLPYDSEMQEIADHFNKIGEVTSVRIPLNKDTNKPRGFAYVEFNNEEAYQKALSLNHTTLKGRRINVQYSEGGKKKGEDRRKDIKAKNFKPTAMRKQGMLAGSVKESQKRSARRGKKGKFEKAGGDD